MQRVFGHNSVWTYHRLVTFREVKSGPTWSFDGIVGWPRIFGYDTPWPAVAPLALAAYVIAVRCDGCRAPSLVLCQVGLVPRAGPVDHTVELEGKDAG